MGSTRIKGARIDNKIAGFYDGHDMRLILESLYRCIENGEISINNGQICVNSGFVGENVVVTSVNNGFIETKNMESRVNNTDFSEEILGYCVNNGNLTEESSENRVNNENLDDIRQMVEYQGGTLDDFLADLDIKLSWGTLKMENGKIVISEIDEEMSNLVSACEEKGVSVGESIRKTAQSIWSMRQ